MNLATPLTLKLVSQAKTVLCLFFGLILASNVNASVTTTLSANALTPYNNTDEGDLKLTASGTPANVNIWQFASTTFTITNEGLASMSGIEVTLNFPATDDAVLQGGNEYQASQGTLNASWTATPLWSVGTLAAGQSATLQLNIFTKTTGTIIYYGQVSSADGTDADSTPGNGTCCTPNEDDEAVFTFNGTSPPGSSCAFFTYNPSQNTSSLDHALLSMEETTAGYTVHFVDRLSGNIPGNSTEGSYGIDPEGNLISETEMPVTLPYDVSVVVNADQTIDLVFDVSPDLPAGTVVPNVFSYPGADAILPNSKATKTSTGYAFGVAIVDIASGLNPSNLVIQTDEVGQNVRVTTLPNPYFYAGFSSLTEGSGGSIYPWYRDAGNFSIYGIPADGSPAWSYLVASDTPASTWVSTKVSHDGQYVYTAKTDNQRAFIAKLNARTGTLVGHDLQTFIDLNTSGGLRRSFMRGIQPTDDGGLLLGVGFAEFNTSWAYGEIIGKIDADGNTVWQQQIDTDADGLSLYPVAETADGGALFAGDTYPAGAHEIVFVKTTATGALTPLCGNPVADGVDLEISWEPLADPNPSQWTSFSVNLTISNNGNEAVSGVAVQLQALTEVVYQGGNEYSATQGSLNSYGDNVWSVGDVAAGGSATLTVHYFRRAASAFSVYAQVISQDTNDLDSSPGNGTCCTATEDDEAALTIGISNALAPRLSARDAENIADFALLNAYPNPVKEQLTLEVFAKASQQTQLVIFDVLGRTVLEQTIDLEQGKNLLTVNTTDLPEGLLSVNIAPFHPHLRQVRVLKKRN